MPVYSLYSLVWSALTFSLGLFVTTRSPLAEVNKLIGRIFFAISWWCLSEFMWNNAATPAAAIRWLNLGAIGYLFLGGVYLHAMFAFVRDVEFLHRRSVLAWLYSLPVALLLLIPLGVPLYEKVERVSWGWAYRPAPIYGLFLLHLMACFAIGTRINLRLVRRARLSWERKQGRHIFLATLVPLSVGFVTDALLPYFGVQVYRLGTTTATVMAGVFIYATFRYRFLLITPESVAAEVLSTVPESVFLVDLEGSMRPMNEAAASLVRCHTMFPRELHLEEVFERDCKNPAGGVITAEDLRNVRDADMVLRGEAEGIPVSLSTSSLLDRQGRITGLVAVLRDVRELRRLQEQLVQSEKMAAVGHLAAGIAHEINNPMTYISTNLRKLREQVDVLRRELPRISADRKESGLGERLEEMREILEETAEGAGRIREIVQNVREFSHGGGGKPVPVDLNAEIEGALRIANGEIKSRAEVRRELSEMPTILACRSELQQVFVNLLVNAAQAFKTHGSITVRSLVEGGRGVAEIEDDGPGIDPDVLPYIFDPFFTTKDVGKGTGLGLTISYQLLLQMDGQISVRSAGRRGTIFRVELPLALP